MLLVITTVVSIITFTMANLFHKDKTAYIHNLTSEMATHLAAETEAVVLGYRERLEAFSRIIFEEDLFRDQKAKLLKQLFEDFREFVAITIYTDGEEVTTIYDAQSLEGAGLDKEALRTYRAQHPLPMDRILDGELYIANSTFSEHLPMLTLATSKGVRENEATTVVVAWIRLKGLLLIAQRSKVFTSFIVDSQGHPLAHTDLPRVIQGHRVDWIRDTGQIERHQSHGKTVEFLANNIEMVGGISAIGAGGLLAGVEIPKGAAYLTSRQLLHNLIMVSLLLLVVSALLSLLWSRRLTRPLERLSHATQAVGKGQFDIQLTASSRDEIGELAGSYNQMASELNSREKALQEAQVALVQSEKMAAFGQIGAGIAHEIKNPLAGILGLTQLSLRKAEQDTPLHQNLTLVEKETRRCKGVIENLLKFARQEKVSFAPTNLNSVAEDAVAIVAHQLGIHDIKIEKSLAADLPPIMGNGNQIQQVLLNLFINSQQAMEGRPGQVSVTTTQPDQDHVQIEVRDDGPGISPELQNKIYEPFFTTKPAGKGTGLGLSVSYKIIQDHQGQIRVQSPPGEGTAFILIFPVSTNDAHLQGTNPASSSPPNPAPRRIKPTTEPVKGDNKPMPSQ
jgi:signal transduction histidine kinase